MTSLQNEMKRQMSHTALGRKDTTGASVQFDHNIGLLDMHVTMDERFKDTIKTKQEQLLANPHMKTSMTTNIRNIMSSHDKGMLTATSRLLHAEVRFQEQEERSPLRTQFVDPSVTSKSVSTLDLLKLAKDKSRYNHDARSINAMSHIQLPPLRDELGQTSTDGKHLHTSPNKSLNRPTSTIVMHVGEQDQVELVKEKLDI